MSVLNGKTALVSGAARGIGSAIAQTMVDHGAEQQVFGPPGARRLRPGRRGR